MDFCWDDYLHQENKMATPDILFEHVEQSLRSRIEVGMVVEVPVNSKDYWIGVIRMVSGPLVSLSYVGQKNKRSKAIWLDLSRQAIYPLGWGKNTGINLKPPDSIAVDLEPRDSWESLASTYIKSDQHPTVPTDFGPGTGTCPAKCLSPGMRFEIQDESDPTKFWGVTVTTSRGGLLGLSYDSPDLKPSTDLHLFYLNHRLHPCGTVMRSAGQYKLGVPKQLAAAGYPDQVWRTVQQVGQEAGLHQSAPEWMLPDKKRPHHRFEEGMLMSTLDSRESGVFCLAKVDRVVDQFSFVVSLLEDPEHKMVQTTDDQILPVKLAIESSLLDQASINHLGSDQKDKIAGSELFIGMNRELKFGRGEMLEVVKGGKGVIGMVLDIVGNILKLETNTPEGKQIVYASCSSMDLFPTGWCQQNGVDLFVPQHFAKSKGDQKNNKSKDTSQVEGSGPITKLTHFSSWCPPIYFNHLCYSSFLSNAGLAMLPRRVGPGPVRLVLREVLSKLMGSSYKSGAILKRLEVGETPRPGYWVESIKGKSRVTSLQANIEIPATCEGLAEFCQEVCKKLGCCPYLFGPQMVGSSCPFNCHTRSKLYFQDGSRGRRKRKMKKKRLTPQTSGDMCDKLEPMNKDVEAESESSDNDTTPSPSRDITRDNSPGPSLPKQKNIAALPSDARTKEEKLADCSMKLKTRPTRQDVEEMQEVIAAKVDPHPRLKSLRSRSGVDPIPRSTPGPETTQPKMKGLPPAFELPEPEENGGNYADTWAEFRGSVETGERLGEPPAVWKLVLYSNPAEWSPDDVADYIADQPDQDVAQLARNFYDEEIDGRAFMLLNYPTVQEHWKLNMATAVRLCQYIEAVKLAFYCQFAGLVRSRED